MANANEVKIPGWAVGGVCTLFISFLGFWGMWSVARADVDNLKKNYEELKPLTQAVAVLNDKIPRMDRDIQEIKASQNDMQKDIKTLLSRGR